MIKTVLRFRTDRPHEIAAFESLPNKGSRVIIADKHYTVVDIEHTLYSGLDEDKEHLILIETNYPVIYLER